jgi:2-methylcitrate dehydratase PrpD
MAATSLLSLQATNGANAESRLLARGATDALVDFACKTRLADLPPEAEPLLRGCFLDFIGNSAFASKEAESTPALRAAIRAMDVENGAGTVIGEHRGYSWPFAALLNGAFAHSLDFDDTNQIQTGHPGAPVIAAALTEAERTDADWTAFIEALVVGYEVCCRIGGAIGPGGYERGFHVTAISGIFGAVSAVSRLRGLDREKTRNAFGLALSKAAGSMQYLENGSWNKRLHPGFTAHDAILSVSLAEAGVVGAAEPVEGRFGLLTSYTSAPRPKILTEGLGSRWTLLQTAIKPYPSCRLTHAAIDAALQLRKRVSPHDLPNASIKVGLSPVAMKIVGERLPAKLAPRNSVDAQFSIYFQVAAAWLDGKVDWSSYARMGAPDLSTMAERISAYDDEGMRKAGATVVVDVAGSEFALKVEDPLGEPENPLGWDNLKSKFLSLAAPVYGSTHAGKIEREVKSLAAHAKMRPVINLLRVSGKAN